MMIVNLKLKKVLMLALALTLVISTVIIITIPVPEGVSKLHPREYWMMIQDTTPWTQNVIVCGDSLYAFSRRLVKAGAGQEMEGVLVSRINGQEYVHAFRYASRKRTFPFLSMDSGVEGDHLRLSLDYYIRTGYIGYGFCESFLIKN